MFPFEIQFEIGNWQFVVGPYSLFFALAILIVLFGGTWFAASRGFQWKRVFLLLVVMGVFAFIGARMLNVMIYPAEYAQDAWRLFSLSATGFSLYGGIIFAMLAGYALIRYWKMKLFKLADSLVPFLGLGVATMRVGCFLRGCCFGRETDFAWGVVFPLLSPAHLHQVGNGGGFFEVKAVHPTQLYELFFMLLLSSVSFWLLGQNKLKDGLLTSYFLILFSLFRIVNFYLRENPSADSLYYNLYPIFYLVIVLGGLIVARKIKAG